MAATPSCTFTSYTTRFRRSFKAQSGSKDGNNADWWFRGTHGQLQPKLKGIWLGFAAHFKLNSLSLLRLIKVRCFTVLLHDETQWCETKGGRGVSAGFMAALSPVKTQVTVINSGAENEFCQEKELHFHPKSCLNFASKKNCTSAGKICSVNRPKKVLFQSVSIRWDMQQYFMRLYISISLRNSLQIFSFACCS